MVLSRPLDRLSQSFVILLVSFCHCIQLLFMFLLSSRPFYNFFFFFIFWSHSVTESDFKLCLSLSSLFISLCNKFLQCIGFILSLKSNYCLCVCLERSYVKHQLNLCSIPSVNLVYQRSSFLPYKDRFHETYTEIQVVKITHNPQRRRIITLLLIVTGYVTDEYNNISLNNWTGMKNYRIKLSW